MKSLHILLHLLLLLTLSLFSAGLYAQPKPGEAFPALSLEDQFGTKHTVGPSDRLVIIAFDMDASEPFAEFLNQQGKTFLADNHSRYIADISGMPGLISKMFAIPKMRDYNYLLMLNRDDDFKNRFASEAGKLTVYRLENGVVSAVEFKSGAEVAALLAPAAKP